MMMMVVVVVVVWDDVVIYPQALDDESKLGDGPAVEPSHLHEHDPMVISESHHDAV